MSERLRRQLAGRLDRGSAADLAVLDEAARREPRVRRELTAMQEMIDGLRGLEEEEPRRDLVAAAERLLAQQPAGVAERAVSFRWVPALAVAATFALVLGLVLSIDRAPVDRAPDEVSPPTVVASAEVFTWEVMGSTGTVSRARGEALTPIRVGERIGEKTRLVTAGDGQLMLEGRGIAVVIDSDSELELSELSVTAAVVQAHRGAVRLTRGVGATGFLHIELPEPGLRVEVLTGTTGVVAGPSGTTVACADGRARLADGRHSIELSGGEELRVNEGLAHRSAAELPLGATVEAMTGERIRVVGRTNPRAEVSIQGKLVNVDDEGRFVHVVPAPRRGEPLFVEVRVRDALLRHRTLTVDLPPAVIERPTRNKAAPAGEGGEGEGPAGKTRWRWAAPEPG